jgi:tetraacyldisaccharide 4'-kinase
MPSGPDSPRSLPLPLRARLHRSVQASWRRRGLLARALAPLTAVHHLWRALRALAYGLRLLRARHPGVPVLVVGNLRAGGTGKTPLVIALIEALRQRGWQAGVVSRGHGSREKAARMVQASGSAADFGDEPLLIHRRTGAPVAVARRRVEAARLLLATHPDCNLLIADDGLQHRALARDVEMVVLNSEGVGNGMLLPSGPLRDPPARLRKVDAVVLNGVVPPVRIHSPFFRMQPQLREAYRLGDPAGRVPLAALVHDAARPGLRNLAACAIGNPGRFFDQLQALGLRFDTLALPDHAPFGPGDLPAQGYDRVFITEKDAVKLAPSAGPTALEIWVVVLSCPLDPALVEFVDQRLRARLQT